MKTHPDHGEILSSSKEWNKATEQLSDLSESLQHMRMGIIKLAKETGRDHVRGGGIEVFKVKRIGIPRNYFTLAFVNNDEDKGDGYFLFGFR